MHTPDPPGHPGVAVGGMCPALLVADEDVAELRVVAQDVVEREDDAARIREQDVDALADEGLADDVRTDPRALARLDLVEHRRARPLDGRRGRRPVGRHVTPTRAGGALGSGGRPRAGGPGRAGRRGRPAVRRPLGHRHRVSPSVASSVPARPWPARETTRPPPPGEGPVRFSVALLAYLRDPPFSRREIRPIRPSSPIRSERRRASADTSTDPASFKGRSTRRPSVVTTTAIGRRSWPLNRPKSISVSSRGPPRPTVFRQSTSLRRFRNHLHRTRPHRVAGRGRSLPARPCRTTGRTLPAAGPAMSHTARSPPRAPVRRVAPVARPQSLLRRTPRPPCPGRRAAPRRSAFRSSRWPRGVLVGRRQEFAAVPRRRPEGVQSTIRPWSVPPVRGRATAGREASDEPDRRHGPAPHQPPVPPRCGDRRGAPRDDDPDRPRSGPRERRAARGPGPRRRDGSPPDRDLGPDRRAAQVGRRLAVAQGGGRLVGRHPRPLQPGLEQRRARPGQGARLRQDEDRLVPDIRPDQPQGGHRDRGRWAEPWRSVAGCRRTSSRPT